MINNIVLLGKISQKPKTINEKIQKGVEQELLFFYLKIEKPFFQQEKQNDIYFVKCLINQNLAKYRIPLMHEDSVVCVKGRLTSESSNLDEEILNKTLAVTVERITIISQDSDNITYN